MYAVLTLKNFLGMVNPSNNLSFPAWTWLQSFWISFERLKKKRLLDILVLKTFLYDVIRMFSERFLNVASKFLNIFGHFKTVYLDLNKYVIKKNYLNALRTFHENQT